MRTDGERVPVASTEKSPLTELLEDARRILFLHVAVPGGKNVAMLREALGLGDAYRQGLVNVLTIQLCEELVAARLVKFDKENYGNNSKRVCRLSGPLPMPLLQELASEGSRKNWWPNRGMIYKLCRGVGFRAADSDVKRQYEGQEDLLEGVSNFVRLLLTGEGICIVPSQKIKSGERVQIAFVEH